MLCQCMGHNLMDFLACMNLCGYGIFAYRFNMVPVSFYVQAGWMTSTPYSAGVSPFTVFRSVLFVGNSKCDMQTRDS